MNDEERETILVPVWTSDENRSTSRMHPYAPHRAVADLGNAELTFNPSYEESSNYDQLAQMDPDVEKFEDQLFTRSKCFEGRVYQCFHGSYGTIANVIIKRPKLGAIIGGLRAIELANNEALKLNELGGYAQIVRLIHRGVYEEQATLIMEEYEENTQTS